MRAASAATCSRSRGRAFLALEKTIAFKPGSGGALIGFPPTVVIRSGDRSNPRENKEIVLRIEKLLTSSPAPPPPNSPEIASGFTHEAQLRATGRDEVDIASNP